MNTMQHSNQMIRRYKMYLQLEKAVSPNTLDAYLRDLEKFSVPGIRIGDMYKRAAKLADDAGLREYFMGHNHKVPFIGHGVGIELNEMPVVMERNADPLLKHTTLALEPKFVIPEVGAVGIENTYVVTDEGLSNLTELDETLNQL